jgi:hypothetical protein
VRVGFVGVLPVFGCGWLPIFTAEFAESAEYGGGDRRTGGWLRGRLRFGRRRIRGLFDMRVGVSNSGTVRGSAVRIEGGSFVMVRLSTGLPVDSIGSAVYLLRRFP